MPFSMNNLAAIPWQGLDTRPYTPGMFGGGPIMPGPIRADPTNPIAQPGGGGGGWWNPDPRLQGNPTGGGSGGINQPAPTWNPGGGPGVDIRSLQARQPIDMASPAQSTSSPQAPYTNPLVIYPNATAGDQPAATGARSYTSPGYSTQPGANPLSQAMRSYQANLRAQVPQQYQQYLPANFGF